MPLLNRLKSVLEDGAGQSADGVLAREILGTYQCDMTDVPAHARRLLAMIKLYEAQYLELRRSGSFVPLDG